MQSVEANKGKIANVGNSGTAELGEVDAKTVGLKVGDEVWLTDADPLGLTVTLFIIESCRVKLIVQLPWSV